MVTSKRFTPRETEVVDLLLQGKSNKQTALALNISNSTVEYHLKNIYRKLGVNSRTEAILSLSTSHLRESIGQQDKENLRQTIGDTFHQTEYSSHAKQFFDPKEEKTMKNRTLISISLSAIALAIALGVFTYLYFRTENSKPPSPTNLAATPINTPRGALQVPPEASTRYYDEVLLLLQSLEPPFHFAAVYVAAECFVLGGENCAFTEPIPFPDGEAFYDPVIWMPDGENGFYYRDRQILVPKQSGTDEREK